LTQRPSVPSESEEFLGILLFGVGMGLLVMILAQSPGGFGFLIALVAGLLIAGGLDLIIHRTRSYKLGSFLIEHFCTSRGWSVL
jgi:hypothetical protein